MVETAILTSEPNDESEPSTRSKLRRMGFPVVALATLVLAGVMLGAELLLAFTGWTTDLGVHQVHDMVIFPMLWLTVLVPAAMLLYRPTQRVTTVLAPILFLAPVAAFAVAIDSPITMLPLVFCGLGVALVALHPAGRSLFRFDRVARPNRLLTGLVVVAAIPLLVFAGDQILRQVTLADDHVLFAHYGAMAAASMYVVVMAALATVRGRDWRFAAWSAGAVAALLGLTSLAFTVESSVGPVWGALAVAWGVTFVVATEYTRRPVVESLPEQPQSSQPM